MWMNSLSIMTISYINNINEIQTNNDKNEKQTFDGDRSLGFGSHILF